MQWGMAVLVRAVVGRVLGSLQVCGWVWLLWRGIYLEFGCAQLMLCPFTELHTAQDVLQLCFQAAWTPGP